MFKYENIKLGADPELFIGDLQGFYVASCGLIGGSKDQPRPITNEGHAVQEDNVTVEFNIPPSATEKEFTGNISHVLSYLKSFLAEKELHLIFKASAVFPDEQLLHPQAKEFGCEPDFNVWEDEVNPRPFSPNRNLRSCGGHVHVGFDNPDKDRVMNLIKTLDVFLGVPSLFYDTDKDRRELYGKAGSCRFKKYGGEYRTLSNWWIKDEESMKFIYNNTQHALAFLNNGNVIDESDKDFIQQAINSNDERLGLSLLNQYGVPML